MPVVVDLHFFNGETIVSPYNCNFLVCIFPALIALDDYDVLMLYYGLYALPIYLKDSVLLGAAGLKIMIVQYYV